MTAGATLVTVSQYLLCRTRAPAPLPKKFPVFEKRKFCTFFEPFLKQAFHFCHHIFIVFSFTISGSYNINFYHENHIISKQSVEKNLR